MKSRSTSATFLIGDANVKGDVMTVDNHGHAILPPQHFGIPIG